MNIKFFNKTQSCYKGYPIIVYISKIESLWFKEFKVKIQKTDYIKLFKFIRAKREDFNFTFDLDETRKTFKELFKIPQTIDKIFSLFNGGSFLNMKFRYSLGQSDDVNSIYKLLVLIQLFLSVNPFGEIENKSVLDCCLKRMDSFFTPSLFDKSLINFHGFKRNDVDVIMNIENGFENDITMNDVMNIEDDIEDDVKISNKMMIKNDDDNIKMVETTKSNIGDTDIILDDDDDDDDDDNNVNTCNIDNITTKDINDSDTINKYFKMSNGESLFENDANVDNDDDNNDDNDKDNRVLISKIDFLDFILHKFTVKIIDNLNERKYLHTRKLIQFIKSLCRFKVCDSNGKYFFNYFLIFCLKRGRLSYLEEALSVMLNKNFNIKGLLLIKQKLSNMEYVFEVNNSHTNSHTNNHTNSYTKNGLSEILYYKRLHNIFKENFQEFITIRRDLKIIKSSSGFDNNGNNNGMDNINDYNVKLILNRVNLLITKLLLLIQNIKKMWNLKITTISYSGTNNQKKDLNEYDSYFIDIVYKKKRIPFLNEFFNICFTKNGSIALTKTIENFKGIDLDTITESELLNLSKLLELEWSYENQSIQDTEYFDTRSRFIKKIKSNPRKNHQMKIKKKNRGKKVDPLKSIRKRVQFFVQNKYYNK